MAHAMASMAGPALLEGTLSSRATRVGVARSGVRVIRAQQQEQDTSRRSMLGLVAVGLTAGSFAQSAHAAATAIKLGPTPPPSGGLSGTKNADIPRDLDLPLKDRFYIQTLAPVEAAARAKESAKDIVGVKSYIDKKAWPYVRMDLRSKAGLLRYDLNTVISAKSSEEKKALKDITGKLFTSISKLDRAAKDKDAPGAEKYYAEAVSSLNDVLAKIG